MKINKVALSVFFAVGLTSTPLLAAMPVAPAGQPIVTGEPSRVGPPWNHRTTINIPGSKTDIAFGGYIKLDMMYDTDYDLGDATSPFNLLNPAANATDGRTDFTAYESRLNFRTHTQTDYGNLNTYLEVHFLPDGKLNLRHAYGDYAGFLAGHTWSNFMSFVGGTHTLALGDPIGYSMQRQGQIRYTHKLGDGTLSAALEKPDTVIASPNVAIAKEESRLPDLTLRYEYQRMLALSGVVRELSTNDKNLANVVDDKTTGYGVQAQFSLPLLASTKLNGSYVIGSGIGNYMGNPGNKGHRSAPDVYVRNGSLEAVDIQGGGVSLNHNWNPQWFSSIGYSRLEQDLPKNSGYDAHFDKVDYGFANVIWGVTDRLMVGAEYQRVDLKTIGGDKRDANRLQLSAQYQF
ncbi:DcaP family trimeric outer membrane transporter [Zobellella sp. DQSA1]|uniref:DcaP family trimeric outer membrane transporter n=1 Tax=Zobellella sp. DQSA1 TaxID=3342386 RepID=UPI0035C0182A